MLCDPGSEFLLRTKFEDSVQYTPFYNSAYIKILINLLYHHQALGIK